MRCKECSACTKGYFKSSPNLYVCTGVKYPFVIEDINGECTEYDYKREDKKNEQCVGTDRPYQTNADKIRSMNDEALAEFLDKFPTMDGICHKGMCLVGESCVNCTLNWLQQPTDRD